MIRDSPADPAVPIETRTELRTFLIADVRGYTRFTQERGDEAAAQLVTRFAAVTRAEVRARGGRVVELRGDEALAAFSSARQALRAAVGLQARYAAETERDPSLPLAVGIGLDAGEAVPVEDGFRGEALNLAARLCNLAGPGEVLASEGVVYLGRRVEGVAYAVRGTVQMKGFADPIRIIRVVRKDEALALAELDAPPLDVDTALPIGVYLGALPAGVLVGREREWQQILDTLEAVAQGTGRLLLLSGEPGVGKTRLAQEVTLKARHWGFLLATGRCYEPEQAVPFYPFLEALGAIYAASPAYIRAEIPRRWPYLASLLPEQFGAILPPSNGEFSMPVRTANEPSSLQQEDQQRLFRAITGFIEMVAGTMPVAILLDDLQWADDSSLQLLRHLARYTHGHRVLLLGIYRDVEVHRQHPLEATLRDLSREQLVDEIEVDRLDRAGTEALMAEIIGEKDGIAELAELVYQRTGGNAFFVQEVMRALVGRGDLYRRNGRWQTRAITEMEVPKSIRSAIGQRLSQLDERSQEILREASVLGQEPTFDELMALDELAPPLSRDGAGNLEDELERALERGIEAGLLRETSPERYAFDHALTQQTLYAELSTRRRKRLHLAAGRALQQLAERAPASHHQDGRASGSPAELAWHFLEGDDAEQALHYALLAGYRAEEVFANGDAERHFRTALELAHELGDRPREIEALERLAGILTIIGRYNKALELLERAARLHREDGNIEGMARAVAEVGHVHFLRGTSEDGIERLQPLIEALEGTEPSIGLASIWSSLARLYMDCDRYQEELQAAERAVELARSISDRPGADRLLIGAEVTLGDALWRLGRQDETLRLVEELISRAEAAGDLDNLGRALSNAAMYYGWRGEMEKDRAYQERLLELAERRGDRGQMLLGTMDLSQNAFLVGNWPLAREYLSRAEAVVHIMQAPRLATWLLSAAGWLALREGDIDGARARAEEILAVGNQDFSRLAYRLLAESDLLDDRLDPVSAGRRALTRLMPLHAESGPREDSGFLRTLAWANSYAGEGTAALAHAEEAVARARTNRAQPDLVEALVVHGMVLVRLGRYDEAEWDFAEARSLAQGMPMPFGEGRALHEWGVMFARQGKPEEARAKLEAAVAIFDQLGARADAARSRKELEALAQPA